MTAGPQIGWLPDGRRLHMNHGPIDLIVEAWGEPGEVARAYGQAADRFRTILAELVAELPDLCSPAGSMPRPFKGPTAWRMERAASLFLEVRPSNLAAQALYTRFGFRRVSVRKAYYPSHSGREDALVLALTLS